MPLFNRRELDTAPFARQEVSGSYQDRLAFIGRRLDDERARAVVVLEMSGSYIVRAQNRLDGTTMLTELVSDDFEGGDVRSPVEPPPTSYEVILGLIGSRLDGRVAANIAIIQTRSAYQIVGWERGHAGGQLTYIPFEETLDNWMAHRLAAESG